MPVTIKSAEEIELMRNPAGCLPRYTMSSAMPSDPEYPRWILIFWVIPLSERWGVFPILKTITDILLLSAPLSITR